MKYRIIELKNGRFEIQYKKGFWHPWTYSDSVASLEIALRQTREMVKDERDYIAKEEGRKTLRVIEEFEI